MEASHKKAEKIGLKNNADFVIWGNKAENKTYYGLTIIRKDLPVDKKRYFGSTNFNFTVLKTKLKSPLKLIIKLELGKETKSNQIIDSKKIKAALKIFDEAKQMLGKDEKYSLYNIFQVNFLVALMLFDNHYYDAALSSFKAAQNTHDRLIYKFDRDTYYGKEVEIYGYKIQFNIGLSLMFLGPNNYQSAKIIFERLIEELQEKVSLRQFSNKREEDIKHLIAESHYHLAYMNHRQAEDESNPDKLEIAINHYRSSFEIDPKYPENHWAYYGIGTAYLNKREYNKAQNYFIMAIDTLTPYPKRQTKIYIEDNSFNLLINSLKQTVKLREQGKNQEEINTILLNAKNTLIKIIAENDTLCLASSVNNVFKVIEGNKYVGCSRIKNLIESDICKGEEESKDLKQLYELGCE